MLLHVPFDGRQRLTDGGRAADRRRGRVHRCHLGRGACPRDDRGEADERQYGDDGDLCTSVSHVVAPPWSHGAQNVRGPTAGDSPGTERTTACRGYGYNRPGVGLVGDPRCRLEERQRRRCLAERLRGDRLLHRGRSRRQPGRDRRGRRRSRAASSTRRRTRRRALPGRAASSACRSTGRCSSERLGATGDGDDHADLKESLDWGPSLAGVDWPAGLQRPYVTYLREMHRLARALRGVIAQALGRPEDWFEDRFDELVVVAARHQLPGARRGARGGAAARRRASRLRLPDDPAQRRRAGRARGADGRGRVGSGDADAGRVRLQHRRPARRPDRGRVDVDPAPGRGAAAGRATARGGSRSCSSTIRATTPRSSTSCARRPRRSAPTDGRRRQAQADPRRRGPRLRARRATRRRRSATSRRRPASPTGSSTTTTARRTRCSRRSSARRGGGCSPPSRSRRRRARRRPSSSRSSSRSSCAPGATIPTSCACSCARSRAARTSRTSSTRSARRSRASSGSSAAARTKARSAPTLDPQLAAWMLYGALEEVLTGWVLGQLPDDADAVAAAEREVIGDDRGRAARMTIDPLARWRPLPDKPDYAGFLSFGGAPIAQEPAHLAGVDVAIVGAPTDDLVSDRPGTRFAPRAIRAASCPPGPHLEAGIDAFAELSHRRLRRRAGASPPTRRVARGDRDARRRGRRRRRAAGDARRRPLDHRAVHRGDRGAPRAGRPDPLRHAHRHRARGLRRRALARHADVPPRRSGRVAGGALRADRSARLLAGAGRVRVAARARHRELLHARRPRRSAFARSSSERSRTWGRGRST